jgi:hypothetical protein
LSRFARRTDSNHRRLVKAFEAFGADVEPVQSAKAGRPDAVVGIFGKTHWCEFKPDTKLKAHQPSEEQAKFIKTWRGSPIHVVRSLDDVAALVLSWRNTQLLEHQAAQALARERAA